MKKQRKASRLTTSIRVNPDIWIKAKINAIQKRMKIGEYIEYLIEKEIKGTNGNKD